MLVFLIGAVWRPFSAPLNLASSTSYFHSCFRFVSEPHAPQGSVRNSFSAASSSQIHLSEGLISEAEKLLCSLVCWFTDRQIRMRFIEGCLDNLAHHR